MNALTFLKVGYDIKKIAGLRVSLRTEHSHQAFGRSVSGCAKGIKTDGGVDIIT